MTGKRARNKGANGEREAKAVLGSWVAPVYESMGLTAPGLERNLMQSRQGGFDLVGIDWLAVEVKRQESPAVGAWWKQTVRQAADHQIPFLMWRVNRGVWHFRIRVDVLHYGMAAVVYDVDMDLHQARLWLQWELWKRLNYGTA